MRRLTIPLVLATAAVGLLSATVAWANSAFLSPNGLGSLTIGITLNQARSLHSLDSFTYFGEPTIIDGELVFPSVDGPFRRKGNEFEFVRIGGAGACELYRVETLPDLVIVFQNGRLSRLRSTARWARTLPGITLGSTRAQVRAAYGARLVTDRQSQYVWEGPDAGLRFDFDQAGRVKAITSGDASIRGPAGCLKLAPKAPGG